MTAGSSVNLGIAFGKESLLYSFPDAHPFSNMRISIFRDSLAALGGDRATVIPPRMCEERDLLTFHTADYVRLVESYSELSKGPMVAPLLLDQGDTPAFGGAFEAARYAVGSTLQGLELVMKGEVKRFFNPIGGLHHARRDRAGGFCIFNDCAVAILEAIERFGLRRVAYVDIDAHHGDGVFYGLEEDTRVCIGDIHEDGRFLYPGTGFEGETGKGGAVGTKMNVCIEPGGGDAQFSAAVARVASFVGDFHPELIFFQCGADGLAGDPLAHLGYTSKAHELATSLLLEIAERDCWGRIIAMGGGGYHPTNVDAAWMKVIEGLSRGV